MEAGFPDQNICFELPAITCGDTVPFDPEYRMWHHIHVVTRQNRISGTRTEDALAPDGLVGRQRGFQSRIDNHSIQSLPSHFHSEFHLARFAPKHAVAKLEQHIKLLALPGLEQAALGSRGPVQYHQCRAGQRVEEAEYAVTAGRTNPVGRVKGRGQVRLAQHDAPPSVHKQRAERSALKRGWCPSLRAGLGGVFNGVLKRQTGGAHLLRAQTVLNPPGGRLW